MRRSLIGLLLALGLGAALTRTAPVEAALGTRLAFEALAWAAVAVLLAYVTAVEKRALASVGLRATSVRDCALGIGAGLVLVAGTVFLYLGLFPILLLSMNLSHVPNTLAMPFWYRLAMVTRVAFADGLLFRGYAIERGTEITGSKWIAAAVSFAVCLAAHWSSTSPVQTAVAGFVALGLTALYVWRRNVWVNAIAHFIADGASTLLR
jgi:uncharacterized protein